MTTLQKITKRAKEIYRKHPNKKWVNCVKEASAELKKAGKIGQPGSTAKKSGKDHGKKAKKKSAYRQTGSSNKFYDERVSAKAPGKRVVKTANGSHVYYERRRNRSDVPGTLSGISSASLKKAVVDRLKEQLGKKFVSKELATTKRVKKALQKEISSIKAQIKKFQ